MENFQLLKYEYVELFKLLKIMDWASSGGEAKQFVDEGLVKVNGDVETQRRKKLRPGDSIEFGGRIMTIEERS